MTLVWRTPCLALFVSAYLYKHFEYRLLIPNSPPSHPPLPKLDTEHFTLLDDRTPLWRTLLSTRDDDFNGDHQLQDLGRRHRHRQQLPIAVRHFFLLLLCSVFPNRKLATMGALLSLPLLAIPSAGTLLSFAASCCGAATCSMVCSACGKCGNR